MAPCYNNMCQQSYPLYSSISAAVLVPAYNLSVNSLLSFNILITLSVHRSILLTQAQVVTHHRLHLETVVLCKQVSLGHRKWQLMTRMLH